MMRAALCCRSRAMRYARSWAWVRCRVGIINPRLACAGPDDSGRTSWPVGVASAGKNRAPPGLVVYTCPEGAVQMTVPSENFLRYRLVKPRSRLSWHSLLTPLSKDRFSY